MSTLAGRSARLALAPSALALASGLLALALAALGADTNTIETCLFGIYTALALTPISIATIIYLPGQDKLLWCTLALTLALLTVAIGTAIWAQAIGLACNHGATCPFS
jgi:uncharacterized membrane protein YoaT (DUF817 family)